MLPGLVKEASFLPYRIRVPKALEGGKGYGKNSIFHRAFYGGEFGDKKEQAGRGRLFREREAGGYRFRYSWG